MWRMRLFEIFALPGMAWVHFWAFIFGVNIDQGPPEDVDSTRYQ